MTPRLITPWILSRKAHLLHPGGIVTHIGKLRPVQVSSRMIGVGAISANA